MMNSLSFHHQLTVDGYVTFYVKMKSGDFAGASSICIPANVLKTHIEALVAATRNLYGRITMEDYDSDSFIAVEYLKYGQCNIYGQLGGSYNDQFVKFMFRADQTYVVEMIEELKMLLSKKIADGSDS